MRLELTHRGSYAIRAVLTLARADKGEVVPARHIAKEMDIPVRFLPQVLGLAMGLDPKKELGFQLNITKAKELLEKIA